MGRVGSGVVPTCSPNFSAQTINIAPVQRGCAFRERLMEGHLWPARWTMVVAAAVVIVMFLLKGRRRIDKKQSPIIMLQVARQL